MKETRNVTCRYGVSYPVMFKGDKGAVERGFDLMSRCCCWICHNLKCENPRNEKLPDCNLVCELWTKKHYCEDNIEESVIKD